MAAFEWQIETPVLSGHRDQDVAPQNPGLTQKTMHLEAIQGLMQAVQ
jgi:hypothetical protein